MRKLLVTLAIAVMLVTAGCAGGPSEDASEEQMDNPEQDIIYGHQVVDVEGEKYVCFESEWEGFDCEPLNTSSTQGDGF